MKYAIPFFLIAALFAAHGAVEGGWYAISFWPAVSFTTIGMGYAGLGARVFGKRADGRQSPLHTAIMLPYLLCLWTVWHCARLFGRELAYNRVDDKMVIGRRLLSHELPEDIDIVVDLTCEFSEPKDIRSRTYYSFPILDGFVPTAEQLVEWAREIRGSSGTVYIHCAQGHGRTALFAAVLLLMNGDACSPAAALAFLRSKRNRVRLGKFQRQLLETVYAKFLVPAAPG